jgi:SAM-dependent methyltransferase
LSEETTTVNNPLFARLFDRMSVVAERQGQGDHRRELLAGLAGRVLELGAGNGLNFSYYPSSVTGVVAVEPEPYLRERARESAAAADVPVTVIDGLAGQIPLEDASVDAGVASLVLCSVPDQEAALRDLGRVIRPGGELRFYEHVRARNPRLERMQRAVDVIWPHVAGGCHTHRETVAAMKRCGFEIERCRRFPFRPSILLAPAAPHVIGVARRP